MNLLNGKLYQFRLRYLFDNNEKSVWSPISKVPLPVLFPGVYESSEDNVCNEIEIKFNTQQQEVIAIDIAVRQGNDGQWELIDTVHKYDQDWNVLINSNIEYTYIWKNDSVLFGLDQKDTARPYDYVPQIAECSELINENQIIDSNITEGYDNHNIDCQLTIQQKPVDIYAGVKSPNTDYGDDIITLRFYEIPINSIAKVMIYDIDSTHPEQGVVEIDIHEEQFRDVNLTELQIVELLGSNLQARGIKVSVSGMCLIFAYNPTVDYRLTITGRVDKVFQKVPTYRYGTKKYFKIIYYDRALRSGSANGNIEIDIPNINEIHANMPHTHTFNAIDIYYKLKSIPPKWAMYWQWAKAETYDTHLYFQTLEYRSDEDNSYINVNGSIEKYNTFFKRSKIPEWVYEKGDRIRILGHATGESSSEYTIYDDIIDVPLLDYLPDTKEFVLGKHYKFDFKNRRYLIELVRPPLTFGQNEVGLPYLEIGEINPVLAPYTNDRSHGHANPLYGNQVAKNGLNTISATGYIQAHDSYVGRRLIPVSTAYGMSFPIIDASLSDFFESDAHNKGRVNVVDANAHRVKLASGFRWGGAYIQQSRINNLCRYDYDDFDFVTEKYGAITKLKQVGEVLQCRQQYRNTSLYVGRVELRQSAIEEQGFVAMSEKLLGTRYVSKDQWGCINPESEVQAGSTSFYFDLNNGAIIADGMNKPVPISDLGLKNYIKTLAETIKGKNPRIVGGYDNNLLLYTIMADEFTPVTLVWKEGWKTFVITGEVDCYNCIGDTFISFRNGELWVHNGAYNSFYGTFSPTVVNIVFNQQPDQTKIFRRLRLNADSSWSAPEYGDVSVIPTVTFPQGMQTKIPLIGLRDEEGMQYAEIPRNAGTPPTLEKWVNGESMRGTALRVRLTNSEPNQTSLFAVGVIEQPT
ncbi:MAG: hypothetical protein WCQ70_09890 [Lentimicrobiaceae bacterium]